MRCADEFVMESLECRQLLSVAPMDATSDLAKLQTDLTKYQTDDATLGRSVRIDRRVDIAAHQALVGDYHALWAKWRSDRHRIAADIVVDQKALAAEWQSESLIILADKQQIKDDMASDPTAVLGDKIRLRQDEYQMDVDLAPLQAQLRRDKRDGVTVNAADQKAMKIARRTDKAAAVAADRKLTADQAHYNTVVTADLSALTKDRAQLVLDGVPDPTNGSNA